MRKLYKISIFLLMLFITLTISTYVKAESFSSNKSTVTVGDSFTVTLSGINGKVSISSNDKVSLSNKGTVFVEGSMNITGTAKNVGTGTITINLIDVTTSGANPKELTGSRNVNITIKEKEQPKVEQQTSQTPTTTSKPQTTTTPAKNTTTNKKTETKKTNITPTKEKEEATPEWGISEVKLIGIKENEEKIELELDKKFNINTYDYVCNVDSDIKKIEIQKQAYEYNEFVTITGLEQLNPGENIITLKLAKEGQKELIYTIRVNKEQKQEEQQEEIQEENVELAQENKQPITVSMPIWSFVLIETLLITVTAGISIFVTKMVLENKTKTSEKQDN